MGETELEVLAAFMAMYVGVVAMTVYKFLKGIYE